MKKYKSIETNKHELNASPSVSIEAYPDYLNEGNMQPSQHYGGPDRLELRHRPPPPDGKVYAQDFEEGNQGTVNLLFAFALNWL